MWFFFDALFPLIFLLVSTLILVQLIRSISQWHRNNQSPVLDVEAVVVSKRADVSVHHHYDGNGMSHAQHSTAYYATFQFHSNDRQELAVSGMQYGQLLEGDVGILTFQGTRFLNFQRHTSHP